MSADDQQFLDVLSSIPTEIRKYSADVAEYVDDHVEKIASAVRAQLASSSWLPDSIRPRLPAPESPQTVVLPSSAYERVQDWVSRHKLLTGVVVLATGTIVYRSYARSRFSRRKRRARRARNGGRTEVVVIAGSPTLPLTRSLSLDMERKGFIVYVVCNSVEDEVMVQNLSRPDIQPLTMDIADPPNAGASIERFAHFLQAPHSAAPGVRRNHLSLTGVILIPSLSYQTSPIAVIPPSSFADLFNTHLLHPILTIQAFLPLLTARTAAQGDKAAPKVLVFTPSVISAINPPFHAPEATVCSALAAFTEVLAAELRPLAVPVTHVQLGAFDLAGFTPAAAAGRAAAGRALLPAPPEPVWPEAARRAYARNFAATGASALAAGRVAGLRGASLRDLHTAVFDVLDGADPAAVVRVGLGAGLYGFVGRWVPRGLVAWMMGVRRVDASAGSHYPPAAAAAAASLAGSSPRSGSEDGEASHEFIAVPDIGADASVWREAGIGRAGS